MNIEKMKDMIAYQVGKDGTTQEHHVSSSWGIFNADLEFL